MITVYLVNTLLLSESCLCACEKLLGEEEGQRILKLRLKSDRRSYAVAHALLRCELSSLIGVEPRNLFFGKSADRKPFLSIPDHNVAFNISHSGSYLAVAATKRSVSIGIDIQRYGDVIFPLRFASSVLGEHELEKLRNNTSQCEMHYQLIRHWSIKEAYLKGKGSGLIDDLREVEISTCFRWAALRGAEKAIIFTWDENPLFFVALAIMASDQSVKIITLGESAAEKIILEYFEKADSNFRRNL